MAYEPLNTLKNEIRLLDVLPDDPSGIICCKVFNVSLDEAPEFHAVSYTWGDPLDTEQILVNGQVREVTASCWQVLSTHSSWRSDLGRHDLIWLDALCINQNDLREREQQVLRMHLIYAKGFCEVHLGDCPLDPFAPWDDRVAVRALMLLGKREGLEIQPGNHQDCGEDAKEANTTDDDEEEGETFENSLGHINHFLNKPWFSRIWIVQEFVIGTKSSNAALIGQYVIIGSGALAYACNELVNRGIDIPTAQRRALLTGIKRYLHLIQAAILYYGDSPMLHLLRFLCIFRDQSASDPRDKVYSLLGLLQPSINESTEAEIQTASSLGFHRPTLPIDYTAPIEEVYARTVKAVVLATGLLDIICACQNQTEFNRTWTPDWRQPWSRASLINLRDKVDAEKGPFNASSFVRSEFTFSDDLRVLYGRGIYHSTIVRASKKWSSRSVHDAISVEDEYLFLTDCEPSVATQYRENGNGKDDGSAEDNEEYDQLDRLALAMAGGAFRNNDEVGLEDPFLFVPGKSAVWCERSWQSDAITSRFITIGEGRRTMRTSGNSLGIGPEELEVGDIVCVLLGCSVPVVLRKVRDYYTFIGECYIDEIMQGELVEALEKGEVSSQVFNIH